MILSLNYPWRILVIIAVVVGVHVAVLIIKAAGKRLMTAMPRRSFAKARSLLGLLTQEVKGLQSLLLVRILKYGHVIAGAGQLDRRRTAGDRPADDTDFQPTVLYTILGHKHPPEDRTLLNNSKIRLPQ